MPSSIQANHEPETRMKKWTGWDKVQACGRSALGCSGCNLIFSPDSRGFVTLRLAVSLVI
jgi:hypothetical protein